MEIIFINSKNEIVKIGGNVKVEVIGNYIVGIDIEQKIMEIEGYESEKEAREKLEEIADEILKRVSGERTRVMIFDLREGE